MLSVLQNILELCVNFYNNSSYSFPCHCRHPLPVGFPAAGFPAQLQRLTSVACLCGVCSRNTWSRWWRRAAGSAETPRRRWFRRWRPVWDIEKNSLTASWNDSRNTWLLAISSSFITAFQLLAILLFRPLDIVISRRIFYQGFFFLSYFFLFFAL